MDKEKLNAANELMALIYDREQAVSNITNSLNCEHKLIHFRSSKSSANTSSLCARIQAATKNCSK